MHFQIVGERHSGTKFIRRYIEESTGIMCLDVNKHALLCDSKIENFYENTEHKDLNLKDAYIICLHRNIFNWIEAMSRQSYSSLRQNFPISNLINIEFDSPSEKEPISYFHEKLRPAKSIVHLRNIKYDFWIKQRTKLNICYLSYDKILLDTQKQINKLNKIFSLNLNPPVIKEAFCKKNIYYDPNNINFFKKDDLDTIHKNMDFQQEIFLGYNYGYFYKFLKNGYR